MQISLSVVNLLKKEFKDLLLSENWLEMLLTGSFYELEQMLYSSFLELYDKMVKELIELLSVSEEFRLRQKEVAKEKGLKKLTIRQATIQLRTGSQIKYDSYYAKRVPKDYKGARHMSHILWNTQSKGSPMFASLVTLFSVLCPSFLIANNVLSYQGVRTNFDRVRQVSLSLGESCLNDRVDIQLDREDSLAGKRVIIGIDGGRTRTRVYKQGKETEKMKTGEKQKKKFDTPWREPKMFVISTIDKNGKTNKETFPIYDASFGDVETFGLLENYLEKLDVKKAKLVQFVGDGAPWIWNKAKSMLIRLGVKENKIIETLDYYHASQHLHDLRDYMEKDKKEDSFAKLKNQLWQGNIVGMAATLKDAIPDVDLSSFTPFQYFVNNQFRIDYQRFTKMKLVRGSGLIESGIRRIINLRFKSPSSFKIQISFFFLVSR